MPAIAHGLAAILSGRAVLEELLIQKNGCVKSALENDSLIAFRRSNGEFEASFETVS